MSDSLLEALEELRGLDPKKYRENLRSILGSITGAAIIAGAAKDPTVSRMTRWRWESKIRDYLSRGNDGPRRQN